MYAIVSHEDAETLVQHSLGLLYPAPWRHYTASHHLLSMCLRCSISVPDQDVLPLGSAGHAEGRVDIHGEKAAPAGTGSPLPAWGGARRGKRARPDFGAPPCMPALLITPMNPFRYQSLSVTMSMCFGPC